MLKEAQNRHRHRMKLMANIQDYAVRPSLSISEHFEKSVQKPLMPERVKTFIFWCLAYREFLSL